MSTQKSPLSIKILFWISNFSFWALSFITTIVIIANMVILFGNYTHELELRINMPIPISVEETGVLHLEGTNQKVRIEKAYGKLHFVNTPMHVTKKVVFVLLFVLLTSWFISWKFRNFMKNIRNGIYFDIANINNLKHAAYGLTGLFVVSRAYMAALKNYLEQNLDFNTITVGGEIYDTDAIILFALLLWVLAHVFVKGIEMKKEQDLTI